MRLHLIGFHLLLVIFAMPCIVWAGTNKKDSLPDVIKDTTHAKSIVKPIKVTKVYRWGQLDTTDMKYKSAGIGDIIIIKMSGLKLLLARADSTKQQIRLFLDGRMIKNISPESGAPQEDEGELQFHLERTAQNDEAWADLLGAPTDGQFFYRPTSVSVGLENGYAEDSDVKSFNLTRVRRFWFWICAIGSIAYLAGLLYLGIKTNLLRDRGIDARAIGIHNPGIKNNPFSLSRFQMAFWFSLVIASFLFIWLITGAHDIITPGVLALIGISAGTSLSAIVIDSSKSEDILQKTGVALRKEAALEEEIALLKQNNQPAAEKVAELKQVKSEIDKYREFLTQNHSQGFLKDLLSDTHGVSFHRLQMFVWTIVLGLLFVYAVWMRLAMPEFNATLLALQGITAGTYLGFKIPEKQV